MEEKRKLGSTKNNKKITIKSFNGIGDLLFATPSLNVIKKAYPDCKIIFNTNRPGLLENNPFVDEVDQYDEGVFLGYPDPIYCIAPTQHHIYSDWDIICTEYHLQTERPELKPELYISDMPESRPAIGVQVLHKEHWHAKKVWPYFKALADTDPEFEAIPHIKGDDSTKMQRLVRKINEYSVVVCAEKLPWKCHRRFIATELQKRGWKTIHIIAQNRIWQPQAGQHAE